MKNLFSLLLVVIIGTGTATFSQTVTIGTQVWMTKNLNVATFRNGDPIPQAKTDEEWVKAGENKQPAWCYYNNDPANGTKYGKLYNWYAVNDSRGLAPVGYHIPSDAEWTKLTDFLGGEGVASAKMKSKSGWNSYRTGGGTKYCPNCRDWSIEYRSKVPCHTCKDTRRVPEPEVTKSGNGTNSSGFSGLPGGVRHHHGAFDGIGCCGIFTSSKMPLMGLYLYRGLDSYDGYEIPNSENIEAAYGFSVRCLKD
jgi:uncharacterized protein (TIGR02145 family)